VGYNLEAIRSFLAKKAAEQQAGGPKKTRAKRRTGTWMQLLGPDLPTLGGRGRPPT
jgi:hypothetical protein